MKRFQLFEDFRRKPSPLNFAQKKFLKMCVKPHSEMQLHDDGLVYVQGSVEMDDVEIKELPVKFGTVTGDFSLYRSYLETLEGCPRRVGGDFNCSECKNLKTLKGCPAEVGMDFSAHSNINLETLEHATRNVKGKMYCDNNPKLPEDQKFIAKDLNLFKGWLNSGLTASKFLHKIRGKIKGERFGI